MLRKDKKNKAFTLMELAISMMIISVLMVGAVTTNLIVSKTSNEKETQEKIIAIEHAIEEYLMENQRLPCPTPFASSLPSNSNFGQEQRNTSDLCNESLYSISTDPDAANLLWGMVPIRVLGLSDEMVVDNWGNKIEYIVDKRFTAKKDVSAAIDGFAFTSGYAVDSASLPPGEYKIDNILMTITSNGTSNTVTEDAIFAIMSHGENELGATDFNSTAASGTSGATTGESENLRIAAFNTTFVSQEYTEGFDDMVNYKTKEQLIRDIEWKDIGCAGTDGYFKDTRISENVTWGNGENNDRVVSNNGFDFLCYAKTCGEYGEWGKLSYCNPASSISELRYTLPIDGNLSTTNLDLWLDASDIETITLFTGYDYSNPRVGTWIDKSGNGNLTQSTAGNTPLYVGNAINGMPAVYFDGVDDLLKVTVARSSPSTVCVLYKSNNSIQGENASVFASSDAAVANTFQIGYNSNILNFRGTDSLGVGFGPTPIESAVNTSPNVVCVTLNGTNSFTKYLNGVPMYTNPVVITNGFSGIYDKYKIGINRSSNTTFNGYIAEVLIYTVALSSAEIETLYDYFSEKYNL